MKENQETQILNIMDFDHCYVCKSNRISDGNSLHIWAIKYECGCQIYGALDTKTHGSEIRLLKSCPK